MNIDSMIETARTLAEQGNFLKSAETLSLILEKEPQNSVARNELNRVMGYIDTLMHKTEKNELKFSVVPAQLRDQLWQMFIEEKFDDLLNLIENLIPICEPDYEFFYLAGASCRQLKRFSDGMDYLKSALALEPENFGANLETGRLFVDADLKELAEATFKHCIDLDPTKDEPYFCLAELKKDIQKYGEAIDILKKIKKNQDNKYKVSEKLAECFFELANYGEAHTLYRHVFDNQPDRNLIWKGLLQSNLLNTSTELENQHHLEEATFFVEQLIQSNKDDVELIANPRYNLAHAYFKSGYCKKGLEHYFYRFDRPDFPSPKRKFNVPRARSLEEMSGKRVLIWREQGVGDELMWYCLIPHLLKSVNAKFIIECDDRLEKSIARSFPGVVVRAEYFDRETLFSGHEDFDIHLPLSDLMILFDLDSTKHELVRPWFVQDGSLFNWSSANLSKCRLNIAFSLQGHIQTPRRQQNYIDIELMQKLINTFDHNWVCVDYTFRDLSLQQFDKTTLTNISIPNIDLKNDFDRLGSLLSGCHILISPITAIRSFGAAIGIPSASFTFGSMQPYDFNASRDERGIYNPTLLPNSRCINIPLSQDESEKNQLLFEFFRDEIEMASQSFRNQG